MINKDKINFIIKIKNIDKCIKYDIQIFLEEKYIGRCSIFTFNNRNSNINTIDELIELHNNESILQYDILETLLYNRKFNMHLKNMLSKPYAIINTINIEKEFLDSIPAILESLNKYIEKLLLFNNIGMVYIYMGENCNYKINKYLEESSSLTILKDPKINRTIYYKNVIKNNMVLFGKKYYNH